MICTILRGALDVLDQSWTVRALEKVNATLAAEVTHLRAQRDELQRENSRFQQEARDARERARVAEKELYEIHASTKVEPRWTWIEYPDGEYMFGYFDEYGDPVEGQSTYRLCRSRGQWCMVSDSGDLPFFALEFMDDMHCAAVYLAALWASMGRFPHGDTVDLGVFSKWKKAAVEVPPVVEPEPEEPVPQRVVWKGAVLGNWTLGGLDGRAIGHVLRDVSTNGSHRGQAYLTRDTWINVEDATPLTCAQKVVSVLDRAGLLDGVTVDFSVFGEVTP